MTTLVKIENVPVIDTEEEQYNYLLSIFDGLLQYMELSGRNKKVTFRKVQFKDNKAGFEIYITNKYVRGDDSKLLVESRGFYPCGLTKLEDIKDYLNWNEYDQCFNRFKVMLGETKDNINLEGALQDRKKS